jgi:hypothetical protein
MHCFGRKNSCLPVINLLHVAADICTQLEDRNCLLLPEYGKASFEGFPVTQEERSYCNMCAYKIVECPTDFCLSDCAASVCDVCFPREMAPYYGAPIVLIHYGRLFGTLPTVRYFVTTNDSDFVQFKMQFWLTSVDS